MCVCVASRCKSVINGTHCIFDSGNGSHCGWWRVAWAKRSTEDHREEEKWGIRRRTEIDEGAKQDLLALIERSMCPSAIDFFFVCFDQMNCWRAISRACRQFIYIFNGTSMVWRGRCTSCIARCVRSWSAYKHVYALFRPVCHVAGFQSYAGHSNMSCININIEHSRPRRQVARKQFSHTANLFIHISKGCVFCMLYVLVLLVQEDTRYFIGNYTHTEIIIKLKRWETFQFHSVHKVIKGVPKVTVGCPGGGQMFLLLYRVEI